MSWEFPEAESPAGSARFQGLRTPWVQRVLLPVRFTGPAHKGRRPKNRSSNSQRPPLWSSHAQGLLRGLFCRYPLGCRRRSPRSGVHCRVTHRGYVVHACKVPRLPRSPGDRISSSKRGCLEIKRGMCGSSGFDCISKVVFKGFSHAGVRCCLWPRGCGFPAGRTIYEIEDLQHTDRTTPSGLHLLCAGRVVFLSKKGEGQVQGLLRRFGLSITRAHPLEAHGEEIPRPPAGFDSPAGVQLNSFKITRWDRLARPGLFLRGRPGRRTMWLVRRLRRSTG